MLKNCVMKKLLLIVSTLVISMLGMSQNTDTALLSESKTEAIKSASDADMTSEINKVFTQYSIQYSSGKYGRIVNTTSLQSGFGKNSTSVKSIVSGEKVELLKFIPDEQVWAVKSGNKYGFVPISSVMKLKTNTELEKYKHDVSPKLIKEIAPRLPKTVRNSEISKKVMLKVLVNKKGKVEEVKFLKGAPELKDEVLRQAKKLRFKPAQYRGENVAAWTKVPVQFVD